jgi:transposase-like protein
MMLKAIHSQESKETARAKAKQVASKLREMRLSTAARKVEESIEETLTFMEFPSQHWTPLRTNNLLERVIREIKRRTRAIGAFPDGQSALMLVCARLRHVAVSEWGTKRYMNMDHLWEMDAERDELTVG